MLITASAILALSGATMLGPVASPDTPAIAAVAPDASPADTASEMVSAAGDASVFMLLVDQAHQRGQSTPIGGIPGGSFSFVVTREPPNAAATYVLDPAPTGGDTITIETEARQLGLFDGRRVWGENVTYGLADWIVTEATGQYADLIGSHGQAYNVNAAEAGWRVITFLVEEWGATA